MSNGWRAIAVLAALGALVAPDPASSEGAEGWWTQGGNWRRTGRASVAGPQRGDRSWTYLARGGLSINMEPTVTRGGVFFGTWGLVRKHGVSPARWDRSDGTLIGLDRMTGEPLWKPVRPGLTPFAYAYAARPAPSPSRSVDPGLHKNLLAGTIEGTAVVDPENGLLYFGRGDGRLYALDPGSGALVWSYRTRAPGRDRDPEGGGQIVGGPIVTPAGTIVFGTYASPQRPRPPVHPRYETNAVYGLDREGGLRWRHPESGSFENPFIAAPALSPDGTRVYLVTQLLDERHPADLLALEADTGRVLWSVPLHDRGGQDLAVSVSGVIFVSGVRRGSSTSEPAVFAYRDDGHAATLIWTTGLDSGTSASWAGGLALHEEGNALLHVYATTTHPRTADGTGALFRLDPGTGRVTASFQPDRAEPGGHGGLTDVTLGADDTLYVGARGRAGALFRKPTAARMYALRSAEGGFAVLWSMGVPGWLDRASPAIGPEGGLFFGSTGALDTALYLKPREVSEVVDGADAGFHGVRDLD